MKNVVFTFAPGVTPAAKADTLDEIRKWSGVATASPLTPEPASDEIGRIHLVQVGDEHATALVDRLRALPQVESANVPASRGLV